VNKNGENKEERNFETSVARKKTAAVNSPITCEYFVATEHRGKISQPSRAIIGNESVPIQLAQCRFPGLAIFNAKILKKISNKIHGSNFSNSTRKLLWFEITKNADRNLRKKLLCHLL